jgi:hypothetical protein
VAKDINDSGIRLKDLATLYSNLLLKLFTNESTPWTD